MMSRAGDALRDPIDFGLQDTRLIYWSKEEVSDALCLHTSVDMSPSHLKNGQEYAIEVATVV